MDNQTAEDKLNVLNTIFGNDLTQSTITTTLQEANNQFDPAVEKLLTLPSNKPKNPPPQVAQPTPMDGKAIENIQRLHTMFGDLTQSVITTVYESNKRDVEGTVDTLLNLTSNEVASGVRREAEVARQEQELKAYEQFKQQQQRMQEEERRATEALQKAELQRVKEEERQKQAREAAQREEHAKAVQEQERILLEFQRKKQEEQQQREKRREEENKTAMLHRDAEMKRLTEEMQRFDLEKQKMEVEKRVALEKKSEEERKVAEKRIAEERATAEKKIAAERALADKKLQEERIAMKKLEEENQALQKQKEMVEAERKLAEARMNEQMKKEERTWEDRLRRLEEERRMEEKRRIEEEAKRAAARRSEEEERVRQEANTKKILELERLRMDEQNKRIEEAKKAAEERVKAMEEANRRREEAEALRHQQEQERKREEAERARLLEEENETRERLRKEEMTKIAQEQFSASAVMIPPAVDEPKVEIVAEASSANEIRGTWTLMQGTLPAQAWLALFAHRSMNTYVEFTYVRGASGEFHFKGLTPGHYEVRIFLNKSVTSRIAESQPVLIGPKVLSFNAQIQGDHIMLEYKLDPPSVPSTWDWVGIYEKSQRRNKLYLSSTYATTTGTITAALPRTPGEYEARLFAGGSKYNDQAAVDFSVVDNDHVNAELADGVIKATWVLRTVEPTNSDWIGLFAAGDITNKYLASAYTHSATAGEVDIPLPKDIPAGVYELRLFSSKVGKYITFKVSNAITLN